MRNSENHKKEILMFNLGVDFDINPQIEGTRKGFAKDLHNMCLRQQGNFTALEKIKGEVLVPNSIVGTAVPAGSKCIGACDVNNHIVEIWINPATLIVYFRADTIVLLETDKIPFSPDRDLQIDTDDSCTGGIFVICDEQTEPLLFYIDDMFNNLGTTKYNTDFNLDLYKASSLATAQNHFIFTGYSTSVGNGLLRGMYSYSVRYTDDTGNRTSWSVATPLIPVMDNIGAGNAIYPRVKTYGGDSSTTVHSNYVINLRLRITNLQGYKYIEVRRAYYIAEKQMDALPDEIKFRRWITDSSGTQLDIYNNNIDIIDITDDKSVTDWSPVTDAEDTEVQSTGFIAKTPRFFDRRLVFMNLTYPSKDLSALPASGVFKTGANGLGFEVVENIGTEGFKNEFTQTYYKTLQTGEKYGWAIECFDGNGVQALSLPITGYENKQYPNRRDPLTGDSLKYSVSEWKGASKAADVNNDTTHYTHEVFGVLDSQHGDTFDLEKKTDATNIYNIYINNGNGWGYNPLSPTKDADVNIGGLNAIINTHIYTDSGVQKAYAPYGFAPTYYSNGQAFYGIDTSVLPSWVKSFSIVRTKRANRVVCQGLGFYSLSMPGIGSKAKKNKNKLWFYSPDFDSNNGFINIDDIIDNPTKYQIQLVAPLGIFNEIYNGYYTNHLPNGYQGHVNIDMLSYARILYDDELINPTHSFSDIGDGDGFVNFGKWVNDVACSEITGIGDYVFNINAAKKFSGGVDLTSLSPARPPVGNLNINTYIELEIKDKNIYNQDWYNGNEFLEPVYIINIIQEVDVPVGNNQQQYIETGHLQKLESIVGVTLNQVAGKYYLVDERWEDCIPNPYGYVYQENRYVWINGQRWLNVSYRLYEFPAGAGNDIATILTALNINGYFTDSDGNKIYGVYTSGYDTDGYYLNFDTSQPIVGVGNADVISIPAQFALPLNNTQIIVKYDNRIPIKVFAGDSIIGEAIFDVLEGANVPTGDSPTDLWWLNISLPYKTYRISDRYCIDGYFMPNADDYVRNIQLDGIRQMLCMFACESRINTPLYYGNTYPDVNYIMRPNRWDMSDHFHNPLWGSASAEIPEIAVPGCGGYRTDYDSVVPVYSEADNWFYGGFRFWASSNLDYAKQLNDKNSFSKPVFGFTEETHFCSEVIWSLQNAVNQQDSPNLKTFLSLNKFIIDDAMGQINFAYANNSEKGDNLFAFTENGICLLITDKKILSDIVGNQLAYLENENYFVAGQWWISKTIGMPDEFWRSRAEFNNQLFFANKNSIYKLQGFGLSDLLQKSEKGAAGGYWSKLYPILQGVDIGFLTAMTACFNAKFDEYWICVNGITYPYLNNDKIQNFGGYWDYDYEKMLSAKISTNPYAVYGMRSGGRYMLNSGDDYGGFSIIAEAKINVAPDFPITKELIDLTVNGGISPTKIEFATSYANLPECECTTFRDYTNAFYCQVPRKLAGDRDRLQNSYFVINVIHAATGDFVLSNIEIGYKLIV
jgi:hypothetical protein